MDHEMKQAMIAGARRARAEAVAALAVAAMRALRAQVVRLRRAWVAIQRIGSSATRRKRRAKVS
jgi:hypothetical protein